MTLRFRFFSLCVYLGFFLVLARLFYWQIVKSAYLSAKVKAQYEGSYVLSASRGNILAADGSYLVTDQKAWLMYASVNQLQDSPENIARILAPILSTKTVADAGITEEETRIKDLLQRKGAVWVPLKDRVANDVKKNIEALEISGIGFDPEEIRFYPEASSAANLLGFVGKNSEGDDRGYFGIEGNYDLVLSGKPGFLEREEDVRGLPIQIGQSKEINAIEGVDLLTHIDKTAQMIIDEKLKEGLKRYQALAGTVIIMDPKSGGIIAMSSYPSYDPGDYWNYGNDFFLNTAISSSFEPGSVFKIVVMASALDAKVVTPDTKCEICDGPLKIDKYFIETWNNKYHPGSSMTDVIVNSDNVGMAYVAQKLGTDKLYQYLKKFGIGELTGIDLQGEATSSLREKDSWGEVDLVTAGFGQGIAVTPIQMIRAASAIANKGILVSPYVVDKVISGGKEASLKKGSEERVISTGAAQEMTSMMVEAAKSGESKWTYLKGFGVAGKTGTAQIPIQGHYDAEKTIASFVGFAPYNNPKFIMLVTLKEPKSSPWASETAAPLWYSIAKDLFLYYGVLPQNN